MSNKALRLTSLEHPLINIIAIALITIGWAKHKKLTTSASKFKAFPFSTVRIGTYLVEFHGQCGFKIHRSPRNMPFFI
jgi:hypothetical protein